MNKIEPLTLPLGYIPSSGMERQLISKLNEVIKYINASDEVLLVKYDMEDK